MARDFRIIISKSAVGEGLQMYHIKNRGYRGTLELSYQKPRMARDIRIIISQTADGEGL
jgi:hypothetical protein